METPLYQRLCRGNHRGMAELFPAVSIEENFAFVIKGETIRLLTKDLYRYVENK